MGGGVFQRVETETDMKKNLSLQKHWEGSKSTNKDQSHVARRPAGGKDSQRKGSIKAK